jgi:hypothetical protein
MLKDFGGRIPSAHQRSVEVRAWPCRCEERELITGAGDGDVSEAGVKQIGTNRHIGIYQDTFGRQLVALRWRPGLSIALRCSAYEGCDGTQLPLCEAVTLRLNSPHVRVVFKAFSGLSTSSPA